MSTSHVTAILGAGVMGETLRADQQDAERSHNNITRSLRTSTPER